MPRQLPPAHARFQPGQSGNPGGKRKGHTIGYYIRLVADEKVKTKDGERVPIKLAAVRRMWREVLQGKATDAARIFAYLVDRMEGKPDKYGTRDIDLSGGAIVPKLIINIAGDNKGKGDSPT